MPPRPNQHWDMGANTTKVYHLCCGILQLWKETKEKPQNRLQCL